MTEIKDVRDPMDEVPAPAGALILSAIGCFALYMLYFWLWVKLLGG